MITAETMLTRKSVRSYDGRAVAAETLQKVKEFAAGIENPFGIPVSFVFLDARERGLTSPVLTGETLFVAGKVKKVPYGDVAFGFAMEELLRKIRPYEVFKGSADKGLEAGERMPCVSPLGYPAAKRSLRETVMRRGCGADGRLSGEKLFFDGGFDRPLVGKALEPYNDTLELVRWAPSAVNKQPWRIVLRDGRFHFYLRHDKGYIGEAVGDLQRIDLGIALCHFVLGARLRGQTPTVTVADPGIPTSPDTEYIVTVELS